MLIVVLVLLTAAAVPVDAQTETATTDDGGDLPESVATAADTVQSYLGASCPAGHRCLPVLDCLPCDYGSYKEDGGSSACDVCPAGCTTLRKGATSWRECVSFCPEGYERSGDGATCTMCRAGFWKASWDDVPCTPCTNSDWDSNLLGRTSEDDCHTSASSSSPTTQEQTTQATSETTQMASETTEMTSETTQATSETTQMTSETTEVTSETTEMTSETTQSTTTTPELTTLNPGEHWVRLYARVKFDPTGNLGNIDWTSLDVSNELDDVVFYGVTWMKVAVLQEFDTQILITDIEFSVLGESGMIEGRYVGNFLLPTGTTPQTLTHICEADAHGVYADNVAEFAQVETNSMHHGYYFEHLPEEQLLNGCPLAGCSGVRYYSHLGCEYFCQCDNGGWAKQPCAPGTKFSDAVGTCDFEHLVDCPQASTTTTTAPLR